MQYTQITEQEMDTVLNKFTKIQIPNTHELVYEIRFPEAHMSHIALRVYSSICQGVSRKCGYDAIRIILFDTKMNKAFAKSSRVNRIETWKDNLLTKARELYKTVNRYKCCFCENYMIERVRQSDKAKFLGCCSYPKCKFTRQLKKFDDERE